MKVLVAFLLAIIVFAGTLVGVLAATGGLTPEGFDKILGRTEAPPAAAPEGPDDVSTTAAALRMREEQLDERERRIEADEKRMQEAQTQLDEMRTALRDQLALLTKNVDEKESDTQARLLEVANSLAEMKPQQAALTLEEYAPRDAAKLLLQMDERARGGILNAMTDPSRAAEILRAMQETP